MLPLNNVTTSRENSPDRENDIVSLEKLVLNKSTLMLGDVSTDNYLINGFIDSLYTLPPAASPMELADAVSRLLNEHKDISGKEPAFKSLEQQVGVLQSALATENIGSALHEGLSIVLLGVTNLQYQMTTWMQDIVLSGGQAKESEEW
ncbi:type III secretion system effector protein OrgC [Citrobacter portucalensis]|uniref:type III secretion system effector protein OrgC n=1 Tax=Citrobacter portucalensis TaxID=1639133 RepID=UPI002889D1B9|nr:type III secretion system effector protein OrgC [Citrobacter portucalensis]WNI88046.1 type III secretion system effector protein OrgC [Citrobacter portucalensis]